MIHEIALMGQLLWTICIALSLLFTVVFEMDPQHKKLRIFYHVLCTIVPLGLMFGSWTFYGDAGTWCWILQAPWYARYVAFYFWLVLSFIGILVIYMIVWIRVRVILHKAGSNPQSVDRASKLFTRFRLYLFSFLASWLFSIVNRLQNSISPASPQLWLYIVQATLEPLGGLWNMLAYGLHEQLVRRYSETFKKCRTAINVQPASNATELAVVPNPMKPPPSPRMARAQPPVVANPDEPEEVHQGFDPPGS